MTSLKNIVIDGIKYVPVLPRDTSTRYVVVLDRGWIFAGDLRREEGRIYLTRVTWVFQWEKIGFDGVLANPNHPSVTLRSIDTLIDFPERAEIFSVAVTENWGIK